MRNMLIFVAVVNFIFLAACSNTPPKMAGSKMDFADLRKLKIENAAADARNSIESKDFRLLAVRGYVLEVPGTSEDIQNIKTTYGLKEIEGTSDAVEGPDHKLLIDNARRYAEKYNQTIIAEAHR
ncbi:MAG: hypothetical protein LAO19_11215 [Acidobacteriia bacterium]|nr:hypothetical protein [Terriglobia bacterium]